MARIDATIPGPLKNWLRKKAAAEGETLSKTIARVLEAAWAEDFPPKGAEEKGDSDGSPQGRGRRGQHDL